MSRVSGAPPASLGLRVIRGVELNLLAHGAVLAANLALTPVLIRGLGTDGYALYTLMWTVLGYLMVLNGGTGVATQRYTAQCLSRGEGPVLARLLRLALGVHVGMACLGGAALFLGRDWVAARFLRAGPEVLAAAPSVLVCVAVAAPAYFALQFAANVLYGQQRFGPYNLLVALQAVAVAACAAVLLAMGHGLAAVAAAFLVIHAALAAGALWAVRGNLSPGGAPAARTREFFAFSAKSLVSQALWMLIFQGDRLMIGGLLSLTQMGYYVVSSTLAQKFNALCGAVCTTAFPMLTDLHGRGEEARFRRLYLKATELTYFIVLPVTILGFVLVPQFMTLWLGQDFSAASTWPFRLLVIANLAYLGTYLPNTVAISRGVPEAYIAAQAGAALLLVGLWPPLISRWGIIGAAAGLLAAHWLATAPFLYYVNRRMLGISLREYWSEACWRPVAAGMGLAALSLATHARISGWLELLAYGLGGAVLYAALGYRLLDSGARELLGRWMREKLRSAAPPAEGMPE